MFILLSKFIKKLLLTLIFISPTVIHAEIEYSVAFAGNADFDNPSFVLYTGWFSTPMSACSAYSNKVVSTGVYLPVIVCNQRWLPHPSGILNWDPITGNNAGYCVWDNMVNGVCNTPLVCDSSSLWKV